MAVSAPLSQRFYFNGERVSPDLSTVVASCPRPQLPVNNIEGAGVKRLLALPDGILDLNTWFNKATAAAHLTLSPLPATDVILMWFLTATRGAPAFNLVAKQINYDPNRNQDGSLAFDVNNMGTTFPPDWGETLTAGEETHASATSSTGRDDSAGTSLGLIAYLQMREIDSGTPTVLIEDSDDNASSDAYATVLSFAAIANGAEPTAQRVTVTGAVKRWLRVTTTGTFVNADMALATRRGVAGDLLDLS